MDDSLQDVPANFLSKSSGCAIPPCPSQLHGLQQHRWSSLAIHICFDRLIQTPLYSIMFLMALLSSSHIISICVNLAQ
jgi:hypothetical protein